MGSWPYSSHLYHKLKAGLRFHQHFKQGFLCESAFVQLFSSYILTLLFFVAKISAQKLHVKYWWNWQKGLRFHQHFIRNNSNNNNNPRYCHLNTSNNIILYQVISDVLLPRPAHLNLNYLQCKLLLSGDIETNPGPNSDVISNFTYERALPTTFP